MLSAMVSNWIVYLATVFVVYRVVFKCIPHLWNAIKLWIIYPAFGWTIKYEEYTKLWTVITGCTDGIGKAYTEELAKRGFTKFILIGRNITKLENVKQCIINDNTTVTHVELCVFDFDTTNYDGLPSELKTYDIGLLVNCCGITVESLVPSASQPEEMSLRIMRVNAMSAIKMTQIILPGMIKRDHGIIVTVGSILGYRPIPFTCTYGPSKAAAAFNSEAIAQEYCHTNVRFQTLMPFLVATKLARYEPAQSGMGIVSASTFARQAVDVLGIAQWTTGCFSHELQAALAMLVPVKLGMYFIKPIFYYQRQRWDKLAAKEVNNNIIDFNVDKNRVMSRAA